MLPFDPQKVLHGLFPMESDVAPAHFWRERKLCDLAVLCSIFGWYWCLRCPFPTEDRPCAFAWLAVTVSVTSDSVIRPASSPVTQCAVITREDNHSLMVLSGEAEQIDGDTHTLWVHKVKLWSCINSKN